jgi:hypothetical protein
MTKKSMI